jgi:hypothetical protein
MVLAFMQPVGTFSMFNNHNVYASLLIAKAGRRWRAAPDEGFSGAATTTMSR